MVTVKSKAEITYDYAVIYNYCQWFIAACVLWPDIWGLAGDMLRGVVHNHRVGMIANWPDRCLRNQLFMILAEW